jgi:cytochrome P450
MTSTPEYPFTAEDPADVAASYREVRTSQAIPQVTLPSGDTAYLVTRYDQAQAVLADPRFSSNLTRPEAARLRAGGDNLSSPFADAPAHTRWRQLVSPGLAPRRMTALRPRVEAVAMELANQLAVKGPPAEILDAYAFPLSVTVICELLGIPPFDLHRFRKWVDTTVSIEGYTANDKLAVAMAMADYARGLIRDKREHPGDDMTSQLISVHGENCGRLTEDEVIVTLMALLIGGYETTAHQFAKGLLALFRHPDQLAALSAAPALIPNAVEEILRYSPIDSGVGQPRFATEDVDLNGVVVRKHSTLLIIRQSVNHDERRFDDPDHFDIRREGASQHLTFGFGPRFCIGAALARVELQAGLGALLHRLPGLGPATPLDQIRSSRRLLASGPRELNVTW